MNQTKLSPKSRLRVLITAPNLDERINVSGISTVAKQICERGTFDYFHFEVGRRDGEPANARWILRQAASVRQFWRELKNRRIDLVHLNTNYQPLAIYRDFVYLQTARLAGVPVLLHVHGGRYLAEEFRDPILSRVAEQTARRATKVLVLSELEKQIVERRWRDLRVEVLENAVAAEEAVENEKNRETPVLIFLGRLYESKGLHDIIAACRILKNQGCKFRFHAYGTGPLEDRFVAEMKNVLGADFHFGGIVDAKTKWQAFAEADIFVLPSRHGEGLPVAMLEAMAADCVVVVSEMASVGAVVKNNVNGFLIEPRNVSQLVERLQFLLENKSAWQTIMQNARKTIEERFSLDVYIKRLENIYRDTVETVSSHQ